MRLVGSVDQCGALPLGTGQPGCLHRPQLAIGAGETDICQRRQVGSRARGVLAPQQVQQATPGLRCHEEFEDVQRISTLWIMPIAAGASMIDGVANASSRRMCCRTYFLTPSVIGIARCAW